MHSNDSIQYCHRVFSVEIFPFHYKTIKKKNPRDSKTGEISKPVKKTTSLLKPGQLTG